MSIEKQVLLAGTKVMYPLVGLGTWKSPAGKTGEAVKAAVRAGYRMIDTANDYNNEHEIGQALKELFDAGEVKREELFIQSKLWNANHRPKNAEKDLHATLKDLQLDYLDAYLIHWPMACPALPDGSRHGIRESGAEPGLFSDERPGGGCWMFPLDNDGKYCSDNEQHYTTTWQWMETQVQKGLVRAIGVCNFNKRQLTELLNMATVPVSIVQNEIHPYYQQKDYIDFCKHNKVQVQAFSPLGSSDRPSCYRKDNDPPSVMENPVVTGIAAELGRTPAQVIIRWHVQRGVSCVPKSITPSRVEANYKVWDFELSREHMDKMSELNIGWHFLLWEDTSMHPNYPFRDELPPGHKPGKAPLATTTAS
eukprot:TRINITY_DN1886_c0_g1_i4.p1 TRINITY_DN1886_c0_g1~~TRINITY_DN1886_c0_g1_i4.p1  ORF type:complete len:365 (+),score=70.46 TRINITY_DN1886_c0_g1_i4:57-1151(+)